MVTHYPSAAISCTEVAPYAAHVSQVATGDSRYAYSDSTMPVLKNLHIVIYSNKQSKGTTTTAAAKISAATTADAIDVAKISPATTDANATTTMHILLFFAVIIDG